MDRELENRKLANGARAVDFILPGGLKALAVWKEGDDEGEIYADATWQENNPYGSPSSEIAMHRACVAVGADPDFVEWFWHPTEEANRLHFAPAALRRPA